MADETELTDLDEPRRPRRPIEDDTGRFEDPPARVQLQRSESPPTADERLWEVIQDRTRALDFHTYKAYMDAVLPMRAIGGVDAYDRTKRATELFLRVQAGLVGFDRVQLFDALTRKRDREAVEGAFGDAIDTAQLRDQYLEELGGDDGVRVLPYHKLVLEKLGELPVKSGDAVLVGDGYGILGTTVSNPVLIELIWSYWHEEGMLVQAMNAILRRFQNRTSGNGKRDPLQNLEVDPLRGVNNLLWGFVQDEWNRLTVQRRAYEYAHQYGISLYGKAVPDFRPADVRSRFVQAFHDLLHVTSQFYEADNDTTVIADAFPMLNALKDTHVILAEGAHNQFGDLAWHARQEMLMMEWILSRPEIREFLGGRVMVPYREPWMDRVDAMKSLQGWGEASVSHFRDLGVFGERILLSVRYGNWSVVTDQVGAANWARYWRPEIQSYIHSYRAVTGVDLTAQPVEPQDPARDGRYQQPSVHLRRALERRTGARSG